ncbi:MAG: DUF2304 domain-containing protein [bacterium]
MRLIIMSLISLAMLTTGIVLTAIRQKRFFLGLAWIGAGAALGVAAFNPGLFEGSSPAALVVRMRMVLGFLSFVVLMITLEAVRRVAMEERYALLWVSTGIILVVFAIYPDAVGWLATLTGMQYVSAITMVVFAFLLLVAFDFSLALSQLRHDQKRISQHAAALELRVAELEKARPANPTPPSEAIQNPVRPDVIP